MELAVRDKPRILVLVALGALVLAMFALLSMGSIVGAQTADGPLPDSVTFVDAPQTAIGREAVAVDGLGPEWRPVFRENFDETDWQSHWYANADRSEGDLGYKWGTRQTSDGPDGVNTSIAWAVGGGTSGDGQALFDPSYPQGVDSWLVAGPLDFSNAKDVLLVYDLFYQANTGDPFIVGATESILGQPVVVIQDEVDETVANGSWEERQVDLSAYVGSPTVYLLFAFSSGGPAEKLGALMDNVEVWVEGEPGYYLPYVAYGFTPTPMPPTATPTTPPVTVTSTPPPAGEDYRDGFANDIDGWLERRWTFGADFEVSHDGGSDGDRQGFLNVKMNSSDSNYVIVSPMVIGKEPPYNIETIVKLRSERNDGDQYGVIFGANFDGTACPVPQENFNTCFTNYYEMRVRYYLSSDGTESMEMKLKRVDSHDEDNNNEGKDLIDWTSVKGVKENDFIEWDITVDDDGDISISANKNPVASTNDTRYLDNRYFGVIVRTQEKSGAEAKFDHFKVD